MYDDMFKKTDGVESLVFLLTEIRNWKVKAEVISHPDDPRLIDPAGAFALIQVDHFRLSEDELKLLGDVDRYIDGVGCAELLKPRVYNRLTKHGSEDFFSALSRASEDVILTSLAGENPENPAFEWRVVQADEKSGIAE